MTNRSYRAPVAVRTWARICLAGFAVLSVIGMAGGVWAAWCDRVGLVEAARDGLVAGLVLLAASAVLCVVDTWNRAKRGLS
jgi:hypothetical protein